MPPPVLKDIRKFQDFKYKALTYAQYMDFDSALTIDPPVDAMNKTKAQILSRGVPV